MRERRAKHICIEEIGFCYLVIIGGGYPTQWEWWDCHSSEEEDEWLMVSHVKGRDASE